MCSVSGHQKNKVEPIPVFRSIQHQQMCYWISTNESVISVWVVFQFSSLSSLCPVNPSLDFTAPLKETCRCCVFNSMYVDLISCCVRCHVVTEHWRAALLKPTPSFTFSHFVLLTKHAAKSESKTFYCETSVKEITTTGVIVIYSDQMRRILTHCFIFVMFLRID